MNLRPRESNFSFLGGATDVEAEALVGVLREALAVDTVGLVRLVIFLAFWELLVLPLPLRNFQPNDASCVFGLVVGSWFAFMDAFELVVTDFVAADLTGFGTWFSMSSSSSS